MNIFMVTFAVQVFLMCLSAPCVWKYRVVKMINLFFIFTCKLEIWSGFILRLILTSLLRQIFSANFRISSGHDYFYGHFCLNGVSHVPNCVLCYKRKTINCNHLTTCISRSNIINVFSLGKYILKMSFVLSFLQRKLSIRPATLDVIIK